MFGEEQDQPKGFEPAGSPETTSPEAQRNQLSNTVDRLDKSLEGKVVTRIPTIHGGQVLIFNTEIRHHDISHLGVSPTEGPILVTHGQLSNSLEELKNATKSELSNTTWEKLIDLSNLQGVIETTGGRKVKSEVRTIRPEEQEIWDLALQGSATYAKQQIETEQKLAQVLPQSLQSALRIAEGLNTQSSQEQPPDQSLRPAPPGGHPIQG